VTAPQATALEAPAVERDLAFDMVKRALPALPLVVAVAAVARGGNGAASGALAVVIVCANLVVSAVLLAWAARTSLNLLMFAALGGFLLRMGVLVAVVALIRHESWVDLPTLAVAVLVTQLGLLAWETRYVSASLAYPGLKPPRAKG
jgi:hypothetical protein